MLLTGNKINNSKWQIFEIILILRNVNSHLKTAQIRDVVLSLDNHSEHDSKKDDPWP